MNLELKVVSTGDDETVFHRFDNTDGRGQERAISWLDHLLSRTNNFSLMSKLNDIQCECNHPGQKEEVFPNKYTIPLIIINLVLKEFGLKIED